MKTKKTLVTLMLLGSFLSQVQAEDLRFNHRLLGDKTLSFQLGLLTPLFFQSFDGNFASANLSLGGNLGLEVDFNLDNNWKLGAGVYGMGAFTPNSKTLFLVPILLRGTYEFKFYPFSVPLTLGIGPTLTALNEASQMDFSLMPEAGFYWNFNADYAIGINASYLWVLQAYGGNPIPSSQSRMGNFLNVSLSFTYHF